MEIKLLRSEALEVLKNVSKNSSTAIEAGNCLRMAIATGKNTTFQHQGHTIRVNKKLSRDQKKILQTYRAWLIRDTQ
jgi:hypothetical protein